MTNKTEQNRNRRAKADRRVWRSIFYGLCAVGLLISLFPVAIGFQLTNGGVFFPAAICLALMGIAWLGEHVQKHPNKRFLRRLSRLLWSLAALGVCFALLLSGLMLSAIAKTPKKTDEDVTVIVLGCQVYPNKTPSHSLIQRLNAAVEYLNAHESVPVIVSGGQGEDEPCSEAEVMRDYLLDQGIDPTRIHTETRSTSTEENLRFSKQIIAEHGLSERIVLVTNHYHSYRAGLHAEAEGFETVFHVGAPPIWYLLVQSWTREWLGICHLWVFGN